VSIVRLPLWVARRAENDADNVASHSASSLGMMSDEEKKMQRIEDIKELLS
jgi:hypothetical protein